MDPLRSPSDLLISLDLGGTKLLGVLIDSSRRILARERRASPRGNEPVKDTILQLIADLNAAAAAQKLVPTGVAICAPGFVHPPSGRIVDAENLAVQDLPIVAEIESRFHLPTRLSHDVKAATLAEAVYGAGVGKHSFGLLNIGTGVAIGLFLDGKVYPGRTGKSGELGHAALSPERVANDQRLEAVASGPGLARRAAGGLSAHPASTIWRLACGEQARITPQIIQDAACAGDAWALELIEESAAAIGMVTGALQDSLDLECIILSGGVANMGEVLLNPLQAAINRYTIEPVPVIPSALGGDAGVVGAAASYDLAGG
jgi:glucokinase